VDGPVNSAPETAESTTTRQLSNMNTLQNAPVNEQTFTQFLFHNRRNRIILYLAAAAIIIQFAVFKYLYPFANYIHDDSFVYLDAAYENSTINFYPIGYPKFLRLISVFAKPDLVLVSLQYLLIQCSILFLLFTIFYFYKAGRVTQALLLCIMVFNPLLLYLANMVSSDGLFLALSMTWFALLLWIIYKSSNTIICWHAFVIFAAFTVRYNALIYPFIAALAFGLSKLSLLKKLTGWGLGLLLISWFVGFSMFQYKKFTGYWQYSPFSGWLLANNAIYAYREVDSADREPMPLKFRALNNMVRNFNDMYPPIPFDKDGTAYMWRQDFPLMQYCDSLFKKNAAALQFKMWASMGPVYSSYGWHIIKKYPRHFLRYFTWPNFQKFCAPPLGYLRPYNTYLPTVQESAVKWFGYTSNQVKTRTKSGQAWILEDYPFLICIIYMIMLLMFLSYLLLKGWQYSPSFNKSIILAGFVWIANAVFTTIASPVELRFQAFPVLLSTTFSLLLIDWMAQLMQHVKQQKATTKTSR
jgi:hypothetical protein